MTDTSSGSAAAGPALRGARRVGQRLEDRSRFGQGGGIERVVHPPPFPAVGDESGFLQHLQMERKARLGRVEVVGELADATLAATKPLEHGKPSPVGERMEQLGGAGGIEAGAGTGGHGWNVSRSADG